MKIKNALPQWLLLKRKIKNLNKSQNVICFVSFCTKSDKLKEKALSWLKSTTDD